jgi:phage repressor protein C with HTH and peptisase S24 domain
MGALQKRFREALAYAKATGRAVQNPTQLAKALGLKQPSVHGFLKGSSERWKQTPDSARLLGVRLDWLARGEGPMLDEEADQARFTSARASGEVTELQSQLVPEVDLRAGAGGGGLAALSEREGEFAISDDVTKGHWLLPPDYLRELGVRPARAFVIEVRGDSMAPTLESGDRVIVDMADNRPSPPGVFVLWDGIGYVAKRIEPVRPSEPLRYRVASDNPHHTPYEILEDEAKIVGRVIWRAQRI